MNNEERILEILLQMQQEQKTTNDRLSKLEAGQAKLEADVSEIKAGQAVMQEDISEIKLNVEYIWDEINRHTDRIKQHDDIIQKKIM